MFSPTDTSANRDCSDPGPRRSDDELDERRDEDPEDFPDEDFPEDLPPDEPRSDEELSEDEQSASLPSIHSHPKLPLRLHWASTSAAL